VGSSRAIAVLLWGLRFVGTLPAQCIVENPGGSKININRPPDADVPRNGVSPIAYVNAALPHWICFTAGYRVRWEGYTSGNFVPGSSDDYLLTRFRLGISLKPTSWFKVYAELQDADAFWKKGPLSPPYQSTWDLRRAYVDFGDPDQSRISFRVGRQDLAFGHLRLIGTAYWRNASRGYDAALLVANWSSLRLNLFASSPVVCLDNGMSHHQQGNNFYGLYTVVKNPVPGAVLEPYILWRLSPGFRTEQGTWAKLDDKTAGMRWAGTASGFDYDTEGAAQVGNVGTDSIRAWAWSGIAGYSFRSVRFKPRVFAKYDFASGDRNPTDGRRGTFDQLYPNIHDHHGLADQVGWQNLKSVRSGIRVAPHPNWIVAAAYNDWWLASATDAFYNASGIAVARDATGRSGTHIGREYDIQTSYRPNLRLEIGMGLGYIRSGDFLLRTHHAQAYTYPYLMVNYNVF
jgi:hypothetical protein